MLFLMFGLAAVGAQDRFTLATYNVESYLAEAVPGRRAKR